MTSFPEYKKPPVIEVAAGIQFAPLADFSTAHVGLYWNTIRDTFSHVQEQAPVPHVVEPTGETHPLLVPQIKFSTKPDLPRSWFLDSSGKRLIQIQRDRFLYNWRKQSEDDEYPRYPIVKADLFKYWQEFCSFLEDQKLPLPQIDQCELTYVNHIKKGEAWNSFEDLHDLFTIFNWRTRSNFLPVPENVRWAMQFPFPDNTGRLHINMDPVRIPQNNNLAIRLSLTARGKPSGNLDIDDIEQWFDFGHEWIVKGFVDMVDKSTDALWEKQA